MQLYIKYTVTGVSKLRSLNCLNRDQGVSRFSYSYKGLYMSRVGCSEPKQSLIVLQEGLVEEEKLEYRLRERTSLSAGCSVACAPYDFRGGLKCSYESPLAGFHPWIQWL